MPKGSISNCASDHLFSQQRYLDGSNYHIGICNAWSQSTGSNVVVAVIDEGIDTQHIDLATNMHSTSYDCTFGGNQQIHSNHGTYVAGIIGALRNNYNSQQSRYEGIAGVAPNCRLMSISHNVGSQTTPNGIIQLAAGIDFARTNGADVINCSWSNNVLQGSTITDAINRATSLGRSNKGCVVVVSTGNEGNSSVNYPANLSNVISVGAISYYDGLRWSNSNYGGDLKVVAPGLDIKTTSRINDYDTRTGTSFAAPQVSGIAALIISRYPNITGLDVRNAIYASCTKIHPTTYPYSPISVGSSLTRNNQVGYGLVNAYSAIMAAAPPPAYYITTSLGNYSGTSTIYASGGYAGITLLAYSNSTTPTSYVWSATWTGQCDRWYSWPSGNKTDISVYLNPGHTGGVLCVECKMYNGSTLLGTATYYLYVY